MTGAIVKRLEKQMRANGYDARQPIRGVLRKKRGQTTVSLLPGKRGLSPFFLIFKAAG